MRSSSYRKAYACILNDTIPKDGHGSDDTALSDESHAVERGIARDIRPFRRNPFL